MDLLPQIEVSFLLTSNNDDIDMITEALNINPSKTRRKEEFKFQEFAHTIWELSTGKETSRAIDYQFKKLLSIINGKEEIIKELMIKNNIESYFIVIIHAENGDGPEIILTNDVIKFAGKIDAEIHFDIYYY